MTSCQFAGDLVEKEYYFGLNQFRDILEHAEANITATQLNFLSDGINLLIFFGENLSFQASKLFENFGFIVDARQVYLFVTNVRTQIKTGIDQVMRNVTATQIKRDLQKSFESYSMHLKEIFDKEVGKIYDAANHNYENLDCWDGYKIPILELGYHVVNDLKKLTLSEAGELTKDFADLEREVSSRLTQIVADLSTKHLTLLTTRSRVATYVSRTINFPPPQKDANSQARRLLFQIEDNQENILEQIASWFHEIGSSLRRATITLQLGAEENVRVAEAQLDELSGEIVDCLVN